MAERRAVMIETADAIVAAMIDAPAATWELTDLQPERSYADWDEKLEDLDELRIDVVPSGIESQLEHRGQLAYRVSTDIGVRQRFGQVSQDINTGRIQLATVDRLALLTEQIHEYFTTDRLTDYLAAVWISTEYRVPFLREHLRELRQFTAIIRIVHDVTKTPGAAA